MTKFLLSVLVFLSLVTSESVWASKARQKALQLGPLRAGLIGGGVSGGAGIRNFQEIPQVKLQLPLQSLKVSPGFEVSIFAVVPEARGMTVGEQGQIFVGSRDDKVYRVTDADLNGEAEKVEVLLEDLNQPNGVAYRDGALYVADKTQIRKVLNPQAATAAELQTKMIAQKFPERNQNNWKFIRFGQDGWLYINLAVPGEARFHKLNVETEKGSFVGAAPPIVGFDWDAKNKKLWVPTLHMKLPSHLVPLGIRFYQGELFPEEFQNQVFMAEQGSWDGTTPKGFRVSYMTVKDGKVQSYRPFIDGWLQNGKAWGRPIDVEVHSDGSLLISDDQAGVIYRVNYLLR